MSTKSTKTTINPKLQAQARSKKAYLEACDIVALADKAKVDGQKAAIVDQARLHLNRAQRYHFNSIALRLAGFLHSYYHNIAHDNRRGNKYLKIRKQYQKLWRIEEEVDTIFVELSYRLNSSRTPSRELVVELDQTCNQFSQYRHLESAPIKHRVYILLVAQAYLQKDHNKVIELCKEIIAWLEKEEFAWFPAYYSYLVPAYINQKRFEEGKQAIASAIEACPVNTYNWSVFQYHRFILEVHDGQYQAAYQVFQEATKRKQLNAAMKEQWLIAKGYIKFFIRCGLIEGNDQIRLGKFFNEIPIFSADKEGNNINIIILFVLLNLKNGKGKIIDKVEAIEKYIVRHLNYNLRARTFLRMLVKLVKLDFNTQAAELRMQKELEVLRATAGDGVGVAELEVVGYEELWGMVF